MAACLKFLQRVSVSWTFGRVSAVADSLPPITGLGKHYCRRRRVARDSLVSQCDDVQVMTRTSSQA